MADAGNTNRDIYFMELEGDKQLIAGLLAVKKQEAANRAASIKGDRDKASTLQRLAIEENKIARRATKGATALNRFGASSRAANGATLQLRNGMFELGNSISMSRIPGAQMINMFTEMTARMIGGGGLGFALSAITGLVTAGAFIWKAWGDAADEALEKAEQGAEDTTNRLEALNKRLEIMLTSSDAFALKRARDALEVQREHQRMLRISLGDELPTGKNPEQEQKAVAQMLGLQQVKNMDLNEMAKERFSLTNDVYLAELKTMGTLEDEIRTLEVIMATEEERRRNRERDRNKNKKTPVEEIVTAPNTRIDTDFNFGAAARAYAEKQAIYEGIIREGQGKIAAITGKARLAQEKRDIEWSNKQVAEAEKLAATLHKIKVDHIAAIGSLVVSTALETSFNVIESRMQANMQFEQNISNEKARLAQADIDMKNAVSDADIAAVKTAQRNSKFRIKELQAEKAAQQSMGREIVAGILGDLGKALIGRGITDLAEGVARGFRSYGADPTAYTLGGWGAGEIASGVALRAGSLKMVQSGSAAIPVQSNLNEDSTSSGGGAGDFGSRDIDEDKGGNVTIIVQGSLTNEETILHISRGLEHMYGKGIR